MEFDPISETAIEGDGRITFTIVLRSASSRPVQVLFSTTDGTAACESISTHTDLADG